MNLISQYFYFPSHHIVNQGKAQLFELVDLGVDGRDNAINVGGFFVEIIGDGLLFWIIWRGK